MALDVMFMVDIAPKMARAALVTLQVSLTSLAICLPFAFLGAWLRLRAVAFIPAMIGGFVVFTRGVPPLVQISAIYLLPPRIGLSVDEFWTGVIALAIIGAGYGIEIVRGAIASISVGQGEAARALGLGEWHTFWLVLAPQAIKAILPPFANEVANLVKASALLSVISLNELTKVGNDIIYENFVVIEVLIELTFAYLVIVGSMMWVARYLEARRA